MAKKQSYTAVLKKNQPNRQINISKEFTVNFQAAILLALLDKDMITKWQFELCMHELCPIHDHDE